MQAIELVLPEHCLSEILEDLYLEIQIVVFAQFANTELIPGGLCSFIIFRLQRLVFEIVVKAVDRR